LRKGVSEKVEKETKRAERVSGRWRRTRKRKRKRGGRGRERERGRKKEEVEEERGEREGGMFYVVGYM
jgi:hypothetical protein